MPLKTIFSLRLRRTSRKSFSADWRRQPGGLSACLRARFSCFGALLNCDSAHFEVGPASAIDPNRVSRGAPSGASDARRLAALTRQADVGTADRNPAEMSAHVIRIATHDGLRPGSWRHYGRTRPASGANLEVRAASTIDPNAPAVPTPSAALNTGRLADLANQPHISAHIGRTVTAATIVRRAVQGVSRKRIRGRITDTADPRRTKPSPENISAVYRFSTSEICSSAEVLYHVPAG